MAAPDLLETSVSYVRTNAQTLQITDTVANQGTASAPASLTQFYLSISGYKDATAILLNGSRSVPALAVNATSQATTTVSIPSTVPAGTYVLLACANDLNLIQETNENNNCTAAAMRLSYLPDLIESGVSSTQPSGAGLSLQITETTTNQGATTAAPSVTQYYLSPLISKSASGARLLNGSRAVPSLAPGATSAATTTAIIPLDIVTGSYYLLACADDTNLVPEANETNNCAAAASRIPVGSDLVESGVSTQNVVTGPGATMIVNDTTINQGAGHATASFIQFYFSPLISKTASGARQLTGSRSVPALSPASSSSGTTSITVPSDMLTGIYWLLACADDTNLVPETNEANNCSAASSRVQVGPDLVESNVNTQTAIASAGATFTVSDTARNQGGGNAAASLTQYYLSPLISKSASGARQLTGSRSVLALAPNAISSGAATVAVPGNMVPGAYWLLACADDTNTVVETNETNNCAAAPTRIQITSQ